MEKQQKHNLVFFQAKSKAIASMLFVCKTKGKGQNQLLTARPAGNNRCLCNKNFFWVQPHFSVLQHDPEAFPDVLFTGISGAEEGSSFLRPTAGLWDDEDLICGCCSAHETRVSLMGWKAGGGCAEKGTRTPSAPLEAKSRAQGTTEESPDSPSQHLLLHISALGCVLLLGPRGRDQ